MIKDAEPSIAATAAARALDMDNDAKKARMLLLTSWVSKLQALRAAEKEKDRAYRAERFNAFTAQLNIFFAYRAAEKEKDRMYRAAEKEKDRAYRAERFNTFMAHRAASQVQRAAHRTPVAKPAAALGISAMACGLAA